MGMLSNITSTEEGKIVLSIIWDLVYQHCLEGLVKEEIVLLLKVQILKK